MLTPEEYNALSNEEARELFDQAAIDRYGHDRWKTEFAAEIDNHRVTVQKWFRDSRPPYLALIYLIAATKADAYRNAFQALQGALNLTSDP